MAEISGLPVYTVEKCPRFKALAEMRLKSMNDIFLEEGDSRSFLSALAGNPEVAGCNAFFYLDAHWEDDLPLRDELEIIVANWSDFVVMIDDFQVPDDSGYEFDQYGEGKNLNLDLIRSVLTTHDLVAFSPSTPASEESGGRRGCVLITRKGGLSREVAGLSAVKPLRAVRPSS